MKHIIFMITLLLANTANAGDSSSRADSSLRTGLEFGYVVPTDGGPGRAALGLQVERNVWGPLTVGITTGADFDLAYSDEVGEIEFGEDPSAIAEIEAGFEFSDRWSLYGGFKLSSSFDGLASDRPELDKSATGTLVGNIPGTDLSAFAGISQPIVDGELASGLEDTAGFRWTLGRRSAVPEEKTETTTIAMPEGSEPASRTCGICNGVEVCVTNACTICGGKWICDRIAPPW